MATPPERIGERLLGAAAEKGLDGIFKIIESVDKKVDMLFQAFIDAGIRVQQPPKKP